MKKKEFLDLLRYYLRNLPNNVVNDIISDYEEHFICGMQAGRSEEDIAKELGEPEKIAKEYFDYDLFGGQRKTETKKEPIMDNVAKSKLLKVILIALLAIIFAGPILGIGVGALAVVISFIVVGIASIIAGVFLPFKALFGFGIIAFPFKLHAITMFFLCIFLISAGIGILYAMYLNFKLAKNLIKRLQITRRWKNYRNDIGGKNDEK